VNFFTTNFKVLWRKIGQPHTSIFLSIWLAAFAVLSGVFGYLVFTLEPYTGDLTRIGGLSERNFGWRKPQLRFKEALHSRGNDIKDYDRYFDVVVIGDSFSNQGAFGWQNYLQQMTSYSVMFFHFDDVSLDDLQESEQFRRTPPALVIYQVVEHGMHDRFIGYEHAQFEQTASSAPRHQTLPPFRAATRVDQETFSRDTAPRWRIDTASHFLKMRLKQIFGSRPRAYIHSLSRSDLFSSKKPEKCLIYYADFIKDRISDAEWAAVEKRYFIRRKKFEEETNTRLCYMIVPDRMTAYRDYLQPENGASYRSAHERMPGAFSIEEVPLTQMIRAAIARGVEDVYLPNDAHWGFAGHRIAAEAVVSYLKALLDGSLSKENPAS
jgi:hypothetical protein